MFITKSESPVVVVLRRVGMRHRGVVAARQKPCARARCSGSMEPAFRRGDILFLNNQENPIRVGEVVVFKIKDRDIPIVHRVMKVHEKCDARTPVSESGAHGACAPRGVRRQTKWRRGPADQGRQQPRRRSWAVRAHIARQ